jgi:hypothetical protein
MRNLALRSFSTIFLLVLAASATIAQERERRWFNYRESEFSEDRGWSLGVAGGLADLWGDIGTQSPVDHYLNSNYWDKPTFLGGLYMRYSAIPALAFRLQASYGTLYANDNWNQDKAEEAQNVEVDAFQRYLRNQDVRSRIWEGLFIAEISPLRFNPESALARRRFQPYVGVGVGAFNFKSQTTWLSRPNTGGGGYGQWVDIDELSLEAEGYGIDESGNVVGGSAASRERWQLAVPLTVGVRWDLGTEIAVGLEYCYRYIFTDYLDGVSNRYVNPELYDFILPENKEGIARDVNDKTWQIVPGARAVPGSFRGNPAVNDAYSTIGINFFWKIKNRKNPWWF